MDRRINRTYLVKLLQSLLPHWMEADSQIVSLLLPPIYLYLATTTMTLLVFIDYEEASGEERHAEKEEEEGE